MPVMRLVCVVLVLALGLGAQAAIAQRGLTVFDRIVTRQALGLGARFSFRILPVADGRTYLGVYEFPRTRPEQHYLISVAVAPAGRFLSSEDYERRRAELERDPGRSTQLGLLIPPIGKRALRNIMSFGPGGAIFGLTFTTSDGKFDVRLAISNLLPDGVEAPMLDIDAAARAISRRYDARGAKGGAKSRAGP